MSTWTISSACTVGSCVEVRHVDGHVEVRDNTAPETFLTITPADWALFLVGAKAGEFDGPAADTGQAPGVGPAMVAPFREVIHNVQQFGEHWSWRCGVQWTRASEGWTSGACRYDHVVDSWDELVEQATAHLAKWHGITPAGSVPDAGSAS